MKSLYITKFTRSAIFFAACMITSCESFVEVSPPRTQYVSSSVYSDDASALSAIRGIYNDMVFNGGFASGQSTGVTMLASLSSDDLKSYNATMDEFYNNSIVPTNTTVLNNIWGAAYKTIYYCNAALDGLSATTAVTTALRAQLQGEAKFLRAFSYFYLVNLFGDVPLVMTTDYKVTAVSTRTQKALVLQQVAADLLDAQSLLAKDYQFAGGERVRATAWAATSMLARVSAYAGDWAQAEAYSTTVINNNSLFRIVADINGVFLKNSQEAIWQLMPVSPTANTYEAVVFVPASATSLPTYAALTDQITNSFQVGDRRKTNWTGTQTVSGNTFSYPFKYKVFRSGQPVTEYSMVIRLAEIYLIRAEARAMQGRFIEAAADINIIRSRAGLSNVVTPATTQAAMSVIEQERRVELFCEWGHRWFDLKRWGRANQVLGSIKPSWNSNAALYPIPQLELAANVNLQPQNAGY